MKLSFFEVDKSYIRFLKRYENKIPNISYDAHDKFMLGVLFEISGMKYYAPISSFKKQQRTNFLIKDAGEGNKVLGSIRLSFMFPVPDGVVWKKDFSKESASYRFLLMKENSFCNAHADEIIDKAQYIYKTVQENSDKIIVQNSCNFPLLEKKMQEYIKEKKKDKVQENLDALFGVQTVRMPEEDDEFCP